MINLLKYAIGETLTKQYKMFIHFNSGCFLELWGPLTLEHHHELSTIQSGNRTLFIDSGMITHIFLEERDYAS